MLMKKLTVFLVFTLVFNCIVAVKAQTSTNEEVFGKIQMLSQNGENVRETQVRVHLKNDGLEIKTLKGNTILKNFKYEDIKSAEYSYTKSPRWKTGLGLGATALIFPPVLFVAIPLGFTKHRKHWLTIRTDKDYAVLKLSKSTRKIFIPALETRSSVEIEGLGENK